MLMSKLLSRFHSIISAYPLPTHMLTSAGLWAIGDYCAQSIDAKTLLSHSQLQWKRLLATTGFASMLIAPLGHLWYENLDRIVFRVFKISSVQTARVLSAKVFLDTAVFGPVYLAAFFAFMTVTVEDGGWKDVGDKLKRDFGPTFAAQLGFWPPVQMLNFWKVPVRYQLLVVNTASILDSTFLSWARANRDWFHLIFSSKNTDKE